MFELCSKFLMLILTVIINLGVSKNVVKCQIIYVPYFFCCIEMNIIRNNFLRKKDKDFHIIR